MKRLIILTVAVVASLCVKAQTIDTLLYKESVNPINFSVRVPDGNYRVTVTLGSKKRAAQTVVRAESRLICKDAPESEQDTCHGQQSDRKHEASSDTLQDTENLVFHFLPPLKDVMK